MSTKVFGNVSSSVSWNILCWLRESQSCEKVNVCDTCTQGSTQPTAWQDWLISLLKGVWMHQKRSVATEQGANVRVPMVGRHVSAPISATAREWRKVICGVAAHSLRKSTSEPVKQPLLNMYKSTDWGGGKRQLSMCAFKCLNTWSQKELLGLTSLLFSHPPLFEEDYSAKTSIRVDYGPPTPDQQSAPGRHWVFVAGQRPSFLQYVQHNWSKLAPYWQLFSQLSMMN